jgi:Icc-related predicted phosphoesterase
MPVVFVAGNHEFYHSSIVEGIVKGGEAAARFPNLHFLEIFGVWFFGATLWTDFEIMGSRALAMDHAEQVMNDYRQIVYSKNPFMRLRSYHTSRRHWETRRCLTAFLDSRRPDKTVVVTHHAPSWQAITPEYQSDITSAAFASNMESLIHEFRPSLWVHGHVHTRLDYKVGSTRVICNPRGYPEERS